MEKKFMVLETLRAERDYCKRQVLQNITVLRRILDRVEGSVHEGRVNADDGFQGNEWRLYTELARLEKLNGFIDDLKKI